MLAAAIAALLAVVAAGVWLAAELTGESAGPQRGVTLTSVVADPERYVGETVTVSGDVAAVHRQPRALALGDDLDDPLLVLVRRGQALEAWPDPDDVARVRGTVRIFDFAQYAQELDELDLAGDDPFFGGFDGGPVIIAQDIDILAEGTTSPRPGDQGSPRTDR